MIRPIDIIMIGLMLGGAAYTFKIKHDSEVAIDRVAELERQIKSEQDAIDILKADWSLLTSPQRLEVLVEKYRDELKLDLLDPKDIGKLAEIIERIELPDNDQEGGITALIEGDDNLTTGTIKTTSEGNSQ